MQQTIQFKDLSTQALANPALQKNLRHTKGLFVDKRRKAMNSFGAFEDARTQAANIKQEVLNNLDDWLLKFEAQALDNGCEVLWAEDAQQACQLVNDICQQVNAQKIIKSKSMISEEIHLNKYLEQENIEVIETDLGEYVLQLAKQPPSHIVAPMVHMNREEVADLFSKYHQTPHTTDIQELTLDARKQLRKHFISADVGITGANFLIADTGSALVVENEGNARLCMTMPKTRIVLAGIEKIIPNAQSAALMMSLLPRSATGQKISNYVSISSRPHQNLADNEADGPTRLIYILIDAGRSQLLQEDSREMLRCIRCGACMNHCPVYQNIGGHSYGWVYPGPMGSVLTPYYVGLKQAKDLPFSATMCGACDEVCPVKIPLTRLLRDLRQKVIRTQGSKPMEKVSLTIWAWLCRKRWRYQLATKISRIALRILANSTGVIRKIPFSPWSKSRNISIDSSAQTFMQWYDKQK